MEEYYRNLIAGKAKPEALAAARSSLFSKDKRFANPFYWAPFVLIGDRGEESHFEPGTAVEPLRVRVAAALETKLCITSAATA